MGMMLGGGIARELSRWIVKGAPSLDLFAFDCARYHKKTVEDAAWVKEVCVCVCVCVCVLSCAVR
jgi:hypothetical protein